MKVLMVGVHKSTKGGMWTVVDNYLTNQEFVTKYNIKYIPTSVSGNAIKRLLYSIYGIVKVFIYTIFHSYDILHVHMSERMGVFRKGIIIYISKIRKAKIIIHMHGAEFEEWYKSFDSNEEKKESPYKYSIAKVELSENFEDDVEFSDYEFVLGIRPEAVKPCEDGIIEGEIYSTMPTGMETTIKIKVGQYLITSVVFGGILYKIGEKIKINFEGESILLFSRKNSKLIALGSVILE